MTRPGVEPRSPGPFANTLLISLLAIEDLEIHNRERFAEIENDFNTTNSNALRKVSCLKTDTFYVGE